MRWNYRIVRRRHEGEVTFAIHRADYHEGETRPHSITTEPTFPMGESIDELQEDFESYRKALSLPPLDYDDY